MPEFTFEKYSSEELKARSLELLEFPHILQSLARHARLPISRELALSLRPAYDIETVKIRQQETHEARLLLEEFGELLGMTDHDVRPTIQRSLLDGTLNGTELMELADTLDLVRMAKSAGNRLKIRTPTLRSIAKNIPDLRALERTIRSKVAPNGELFDNATPYLRELRQEVRAAYERAIKPLDHLRSSELGNDILQDNFVTVRSERLVVPVKAEFRNRVPGVVHGVSDSGATLFMEPLSNVASCNAWRERVAEEAEEAGRIKRQLSILVAKSASMVSEALDLAAKLDLTFAKARYGQAIQAEEIGISDGTLGIRLMEAKHPLLLPPIVPVSIKLESPLIGLVITGPNTGGKTVVLKTIGLLVLMHQSGLHLPANATSCLPVFDSVYADIGDQQDLRYSVSTFSSHMSVISGILKGATKRSLVLLDELGTSTDPDEGVALAKAILSKLMECSVSTVITTHYRDMASFAEKHEALENASMELDMELLQPTYHLTMGLPGRSFGFSIAKKLGLDSSVVQRAREFQDPNYLAADELLISIQQERQLTNSRLREAEQAQSSAIILQDHLQKELEKFDHSRDQILEEVRHELQQKAKDVLKVLRRAEAAAAWTAPPDRILVEAQQEVTELQRQLRSKSWKKRAYSHLHKGPLAIGDLVEIGSLGLTGKVTGSPTSSDKVEVLVGTAKVLLSSSRLRKVGETGVSSPTSINLTVQSDTTSLGPEPKLDLRGLRLAEALRRLDAFLDQALVQGHKQVGVIHGKGTGALRHGIWRHLALHQSVHHYDFASYDSGGDGVTLIELA